MNEAVRLSRRKRRALQLGTVYTTLIADEPILNFENRSATEIRERVASLFERVGLRADQMVK